MSERLTSPSLAASALGPSLAGRLPIAIAGAGGRMGRRLVATIAADAELELVGALEDPASPLIGQDAGRLAGLEPLGIQLEGTPEHALARASVLVEFTRATALPRLAEWAATSRVGLVSGSTGVDGTTHAALRRAAEQIPVLWAPNFSLGVAVLRALTRQAAAWLGPGYDVEILELHHRNKADAPSGTALSLAEAARAGRGGGTPRCSREGLVGPRPADEVGIFGLRGGDVVGEHTVLLLGQGERLELTHRASSRDLLVNGALAAARWLAGRAPGLYTLEQMLGLPG